MGKYSEQVKLAVVEDYCSDQSDLKDTAQRHGVDVSSLRKWVAAYRVYGAAGVNNSPFHKAFSCQFFHPRQPSTA